MLANRKNSKQSSLQNKQRTKNEKKKVLKPSGQVKTTRLLHSRYVPVYPKNYEREYYRVLRSVVRKLKDITKEKFANIQSRFRKDAAGDVFTYEDIMIGTAWSDEFIEEILRDFADSRLRTALNKQIYDIMNGVDVIAKNNLKRSLERAVGVDIFINDTALLKSVEQEWFSSQSRLVNSIVSQFTEKLQTIISNGVQFGSTYDDVAEEIEELYDITDSRAKFIARNEISNFNAGVTRQRMEDCGIEVYEWSTSQDERVRDSHKEREGKYFYWNKKEDGEINGVHVYATPDCNPGEDFNCRCVAIAVIDLETWNMANAIPMSLENIDFGNVG